MSYLISRLTVFFDDPFWVGLFELKFPDGKCLAARHVFGAEPADAGVYLFLKTFTPKYGTLDGCTTDRRESAEGVKRRIRRAAAEVRGGRGEKKALDALKRLRETELAASKKESRAQTEAERDRKFEKKREKKRGKRKGH